MKCSEVWVVFIICFFSSSSFFLSVLDLNLKQQKLYLLKMYRQSVLNTHTIVTFLNFKQRSMTILPIISSINQLEMSKSVRMCGRFLSSIFFFFIFFFFLLDLFYFKLKFIFLYKLFNLVFYFITLYIYIISIYHHCFVIKDDIEEEKMLSSIKLMNWPCFFFLNLSWIILEKLNLTSRNWIKLVF